MNHQDEFLQINDPQQYHSNSSSLNFPNSIFLVVHCHIFDEEINNQQAKEMTKCSAGQNLNSSYPRVASKFSDVNVTTCASIAAAEKIKVKRALILLELLQKKRPWLSLG